MILKITNDDAEILFKHLATESLGDWSDRIMTEIAKQMDWDSLTALEKMGFDDAE